MDSKMKEILKQLEQANGDLTKGLENKGQRTIIDASGKKQKITVEEVHDKKIEEAKKLVDYTIDNDIIGDKSIKSETDLKEVKNRIDKLIPVLENMDKSKMLADASHAAAKKQVEDLLDKVKTYQKQLVDKQKAIETYKSKGYQEKDHLLYENMRKDNLTKENERIDKKLAVEAELEDIFDDEFKEYSKTKEQLTLIDKLKRLNDELANKKKEIKNEKDSSKVAGLIQEKSNILLEFNKTRKKYTYKYGDIDIPDTEDKLEKEGTKKIDSLRNDIAKQETSVLGAYKVKMESIVDTSTTPPTIKNPILAKKIQDFCMEYGIEESKILGNGDISEVINITMNEKNKLMNKKFVNEQTKQEIDDTISKLGELNKIKQEFEDIDKQDDKDILQTTMAKNKVDADVQKQLSDSKLANIDDIKRKDLRIALKNTIYKGKRFAAARAAVASIFKKRATKKVREHYKQSASDEYVKKARENAKKKYDDEQNKHAKWADQYKVKATEHILNNNTIDHSKIYEEMDKEER